MPAGVSCSGTVCASSTVPGEFARERLVSKLVMLVEKWLLWLVLLFLLASEPPNDYFME